MIRLLDFLCCHFNLGKAIGLVLLGLLAIVIGKANFNLLEAYFQSLFFGLLIIGFGIFIFLNWWKDNRFDKKLNERHNEVLGEIDGSTKKILTKSGQNNEKILAHIDQKFASLTQITKVEIRELPISELGKKELEDASDLLAEGDPKGAIIALADETHIVRELKELSINMAYRHFLRGNAYADLVQWNDSLESFNQATNYKSDFSEAWSNRGIVLSKLGRHEEAIESYDTALRHKGDYAGAWYNRGYVLSILGRHEEAIESYDTALRHKGDYAGAWCNRGNVLSILGRHQEAFESYDAALRHKGDLAEAWCNRGIVLSKLGRHEEAIESYDAALRHKGDFAEAWGNRGNALRELGRHDEAVKSYDTALCHRPDYAIAWANRGVALSKLGRHQEAMYSFQKSLEVAPADWLYQENVKKEIEIVRKKLGNI